MNKINTEDKNIKWQIERYNDVGSHRGSFRKGKSKTMNEKQIIIAADAIVKLAQVSQIQTDYLLEMLVVNIISEEDCGRICEQIEKWVKLRKFVQRIRLARLDD